MEGEASSYTGMKSPEEKKEAIVQVSDSLPCCWRETSLFSDLEPEERPAPQQHLIFNSSAPLLGRERGSAEIHSLGVIQPGQTVTEHSCVIYCYQITAVMCAAPRGEPGSGKGSSTSR